MKTFFKTIGLMTLAIIAIVVVLPILFNVTIVLFYVGIVSVFFYACYMVIKWWLSLFIGKGNIDEK